MARANLDAEIETLNADITRGAKCFVGYRRSWPCATNGTFDTDVFHKAQNSAARIGPASLHKRLLSG